MRGMVLSNVLILLRIRSDKTLDCHHFRLMKSLAGADFHTVEMAPQ